MAENNPVKIQSDFFATTESGGIKVDVILQNETVWLTQKANALLFGKDRSVINKHLKNIFSSIELEELSVCANFAHTANDGKIYNTKHNC